MGLVMNPLGHATVCCRAMSNWDLIDSHHIEKIDDLTDFYNGSYHNNLRKAFLKDAWSGLKECSECSGQEACGARSGRIESWDSKIYENRHFEEDYEAWERGERIPVRYLEFTMSNMCNQQCSTCSSFYSTRWKSLDQKFGREVHDTTRLSEESVQKMMDLLPDLDVLTIKGGEPFADPNNQRLLKRLQEVNPTCWVHFVSNMQSIREDWWPVLEEISASAPDDFFRLSIAASIDGIDDSYNWIRGGNFEKTMASIHRYHEVTGRQVVINTCISIYNIFGCAEIYERLAHDPAVLVVLYHNVTTGPEWITVNNLSQEVYDAAVEEQCRRIAAVENPTVAVEVDGLKSFKVPDDFDHSERMWAFMDQMNAVRGYRIEDCMPGLKAYRESTVGLGPLPSEVVEAHV